jgi:SAM-dependent methyltransferase
MLAAARAKGVAEFRAGDIRTLDLDRTFDAALMMFAVLGYQVQDEDVTAALKTVRRHLRSGGLFLFDVWYGPVVVRQKPSSREKTIGPIRRLASSDLDADHHVCTVRYRVSRFERRQVVEEAEENHQMRYFFPAELASFLEVAGLGLLRLGAFPEWAKDPDETTWNVLGVTRAL